MGFHEDTFKLQKHSSNSFQNKDYYSIWCMGIQYFNQVGCVIIISYAITLHFLSMTKCQQQRLAINLMVLPNSVSGKGCNQTCDIF